MTSEASVESVGSPRALLLSGAVAGAWQLDPAASTMAFHVKHFWGAVTVRGTFGVITGHLLVDASGKVTGSIAAESASVGSGNAQRDKHLRAAAFFDVANHPTVEFSVDGVEPVGDETLRVTGSLTAAGHSVPITFDARVSDASDQRVTVDGEVSVDRRSGFAMTWSPLGMAAPTALLVVHAVFSKSSADTT